MKIVRLEKIVDILDNLRIPINSEERANRKGTVPYYGATGQVGTIDKAIFNETLILLGEDGVPFFDPVKHKAYEISGPSWVNNHAHVLRAKSDLVNHRYLLHYLNSFDYTGYVNGSTRLKLTQGDMKRIPVPLKLLDEQCFIAEKLDSAFAEIDLLERNLELSDEKANQLLESLLNSVFSLTTDENESTNDSGVQSVVTKLVPLSEVFTLEYGKPLDEEFRKGDGAFQAYGANGPISRANKYLIEGPCIIVGRKGSAGEITFVETNVWPLDVTYYVKHNPEESDLRYLFYTLKRLNIKQFVRGVKPGLNRNDVYGLEIPLPSPEKQREIVEKLDRVFAEIQSLKAQIRTKKDYAISLRQSLLSSAFTQEEAVA